MLIFGKLSTVALIFLLAIWNCESSKDSTTASGKLRATANGNESRDLNWLSFTHAPTCPAENPMESATPVSCEGDMVCNYGVDECCGDKFPTAICECCNGVFKCTPHQVCKYRTCPDDNCPESEPAHNDACDTPTSSTCAYRRRSCCGKTYDQRVFVCFDEKWRCSIDLLMEFDCNICEKIPDEPGSIEGTFPPVSSFGFDPVPSPTPRPIDASMPVFTPNMSPAFVRMIPDEVIDNFKPVPLTYVTSPPSKAGPTDYPTPCPTTENYTHWEPSSPTMDQFHSLVVPLHNSTATKAVLGSNTLNKTGPVVVKRKPKRQLRTEQAKSQSDQGQR